MKRNSLKVLIASTALALGTGTQAHAVTDNSELITTFTLTVGASIDAQTIDEAEEVTNNYLSNLSAANDVTQEKIISSLSKVVNTKDGYYTLSISNWNKKEATETSRGYLSFEVSIRDNNGNVKTCYYNLKYIAALAQSPETIKGMYSDRLTNYVASNSTTTQDILNLVNITNEDIVAEVTEYKVEPATSISVGHITGFINVYDKTIDTEDITPVPIDIVIQPNKYELSTAANQVSSYLTKYAWTNETDFGQLLIDLTELLDGQNISVSYGYGNDAPAIIKATPDSIGKVSGKVILTGKDLSGETASVSVDINQSIAKLPQDLNSAFTNIKTKYNDYVATNVTSADSIVVYVMPCILTDNIEVEVLDFVRNDATESQAGSISGTLIVRDTITKEENSFSIDKSISKLPQTSMGVIGLLTNSQGVLTMTNTTTEEDLRNTLQILVSGATGSSMTLSTGDYSINPATTDSPGSVHVKATVEDSDGNVATTDLTFTIHRLSKNSEDAAGTIKDKIENSSTDDVKDITDTVSFENYLKNLLGLAGGDVTIDTSNIIMKPATKTEAGFIKGYVLITDKLGTSTQLPIDMVLPATGTADEIKEALNTEVNNIVTNNKVINNLTNLQNLIEDLKKKYPDFEFDLSGLKEIPATPDKEGSISGYITLIGPDGTPIQVPVNMTTEKVVVTPDYINKTYIQNSNYSSIKELNNLLEELKAKYPNVSIDWSNVREEPATPEKEGSISGYVTIIGPDGKPVQIDVSKVLEKVSLTSEYLNNKFNTTNSFTSISALETWIKSQIGTLLPGASIDTSQIKQVGRYWTGTLVITDKDGNVFKPTINIAKDFSGSSSGGSSSSSSKSRDDNEDATIIEVENNSINKDRVESNKDIDTLFSGALTLDYVTDSSSKGEAKGVSLNGEINFIKVDAVQGNKCVVNSDKDKIVVSKVYEYSSEIDKYFYKKDIPVNYVDGNKVEFDTQVGKSYLLSQTELGDELVAKSGWVEGRKEPSGTPWYFVNDSSLRRGWIYSDNNWYHLDEETGVMSTGWKLINNNWYYLNQISDGTKGKMLTGWIYSKDSWYHLNNTTGKMDTGWINTNGNWYYLNAYSGKMLSNTTTVINGVSYTFDNTGKMI